ncbi:TetR/AcrR family transcriptional regulator [Sphingobacterium sp. UBA5670]|uniref:TetR/AcrR family transcriptional regulator n=1 Tax=Sphingobacterium sp. UBA5670 TaxID=1947502 RepID=UPI0025DC39EF|nr:TetR family transcriptional regulator [Sphingobacterium sp. UBA5670]
MSIFALEIFRNKMTVSKEPKRTDISTEEKIKEAARVVFFKKGFAATRTRDIAEEAGINLALLNYYFRSKAKLFEIIMIETLTRFVNSIQTVVNEENTTLEEKLVKIASRYIDLLLEESEIPTFLVTEIRSNPAGLKAKFPMGQTIINSVFFKQYQEAHKQGKIVERHPIHFMMNLIGLIVFPFIAKPMLLEVSGVPTSEFNKAMEERKKLIPIWLKVMMEAK